MMARRARIGFFSLDPALEGVLERLRVLRVFTLSIHTGREKHFLHVKLVWFRDLVGMGNSVLIQGLLYPPKNWQWLGLGWGWTNGNTEIYTESRIIELD